MSKTIGQRLRQIIKDRGIKQTWVAERAGMPYSTLQSVLDDKRAPSADTLFKIASALGVSADWLLGLKDEAS
jgi:transcriptional regulator with XRE-family HTH domain